MKIVTGRRPGCKARVDVPVTIDPVQARRIFWNWSS